MDFPNSPNFPSIPPFPTSSAGTCCQGVTLAPKASPWRSSAAWGFSGLLGEKQGENGWKMDGNVVHKNGNKLMGILELRPKPWKFRMFEDILGSSMWFGGR